MAGGYGFESIIPEKVTEGRRLTREFFTRDGLTVARELLGKVLVHETFAGRVRGIITEVESYMGEKDRGSHSYGGKRTARTEPMFHQGGTSYVYLIYGMYRCMNIVAAVPDVPQAVLLRGAVPAEEDSRRRMERLRIKELEEKAERRETRQVRGASGEGDLSGRSKGEVPAWADEEIPTRSKGEVPASVRSHLCDGPGRLCVAMDIRKEDNDIDLVESPVFYVTEGIKVLPGQIHAGKRIGIDYAGEAADYLWRFYL